LINHKTSNQQQGTAIVFALFVMALVATLAVVMIENLRIDVRSTDLIFNDNKASLAAQGSVNWAQTVLKTNFLQSKNKQAPDKLPLKSLIKTNGMKITSVIYDAQGYLNFNNLIDKNYYDVYLKLISNLCQFNAAKSKSTLFASIDWISTNSRSEFDSSYAKEKPPYRAPHHIVGSISEIRLVKNIDANCYRKIFPNMIALPETTLINVNTAPIPVLMSLSPTMTVAGAKAIDDYRKQAMFTDVTQFMQFPVARNNKLDDKILTTLSAYFLVETEVSIGEQRVMRYTLLQRIIKDAKPKIIVLWQSKGSL